jgi:hypothetical protein
MRAENIWEGYINGRGVPEYKCLTCGETFRYFSQMIEHVFNAHKSLFKGMINDNR